MCDMSPYRCCPGFTRNEYRWTLKNGLGSGVLLASFYSQEKVRGIKTGQEERREGRRSLGNCKCTNRKKETKACRRGI
jgi:hypothetical protein